jgi:diguanylate cyclase (GGDEF)-like protein
MKTNTKLLIFDNLETAQHLEEILEGKYECASKDMNNIIQDVKNARPQPDFVMLNVDEPNSLEAIKQLKKMEIAVIATSSKSRDSDLEARALEMGAKDFLGKPLHKKTVATRVGMCVTDRKRDLELITDPLTGILNKRGYDEKLRMAVDNAKETGENISLIKFDLDSFKAVNTRYGHDQADELLKAVAKAAFEGCRADSGIDFAARQGGDEFAIILQGASPEGAKAIADRVLRSVRDISIELKLADPRGGPLTEMAGCRVSIGVATCASLEGMCLDVLKEQAEKMAQMAKGEIKEPGYEGEYKNRVCACEYTPEIVRDTEIVQVDSDAGEQSLFGDKKDLLIVFDEKEAALRVTNALGDKADCKHMGMENIVDDVLNARPKPDFVILNIDELNGLNAMGTLIDMGIKVVATSNEKTPNIEAAALEFGASDFLLKPLQENTLAVRLGMRMTEKKRDLELITDPLTGALNKRGYDEKLQMAFDNAAEHGKSISLIKFDLDSFKDVNTRYGHDQADELLKEVAKAAVKGCRAGDGVDFVARQGGDEYAVILQGATPDEAKRVADHILDNVRKISIELKLAGTENDREMAGCSVSIGVATSTNCVGMNLETLKAEAEKMVQIAKGEIKEPGYEGTYKNRVCGCDCTPEIEHNLNVGSMRKSLSDIKQKSHQGIQKQMRSVKLAKGNVVETARLSEIKMVARAVKHMMMPGNKVAQMSGDNLNSL